MSNAFLDTICAFLETYKGRDKVLRTLCYSTKLVGGLTENAILSKRLHIFSAKMSSTRTVLRLLDDLPMLKYSLEYGLGEQEPERFLSVLGVLTNVIDQLYYPIEKVAWLAEHKLIFVQNSSKWDTASSICWVLSIYLNLLRSLRQLHRNSKLKNMTDFCEQMGTAEMDKFMLTQKFAILTCVRLSLDLVHAINTLPQGILWAGKLNTWHVGLIGTLSSFLGLYQVFARK